MYVVLEWLHTTVGWSMRQNGQVPKVFVPRAGERPVLVDLAIEVLGSSARLELLRFIAKNPGSHFGRISDGVPGLGQTSLGRHLRALEDAGVVNVDLPPEERRGRSPRYTIESGRLDELTAAWISYVTTGSVQ